MSLLLLIAMVSLTYAYWHFTNDRRVTRLAQRELSRVLGGKVRVDHARFRLFGPVEMRGVRIWLPEDDADTMSSDPPPAAPATPAEPFFHARLIRVQHSPWALLAGRFEPTDIYCGSATLTANRDETTGKIDLERLLPLLQRSRPDDERPTLPSVHVRHCDLRVVQSQGQLRQTLQWQVGLTMGYHSPGVYRVMWEAADDAGRSQHQGIDIDLGHGRLMPMGTIDIEQSTALLPPKYHDWVRRYDVKGEIRLVPTAANGGTTTDASTASRAASTSAPIIPDVFQCDLIDVSLQFPPEEGGLTVHHLFGTLRFSRDGIEFQNVRGRLKQAGDAEFTLRGRYGGFTLDSAFTTELTVKDLALPDLADVGGPLIGVLDWIEKELKLHGGRFDVIASASRDGDGALDYQAAVTVKGMGMEAIWFPMAVTDVTGLVVLDKTGVHLRDMTARQGPATLKIGGSIYELVFNAPLNITVETPDARADESLAHAADHIAPGLWQALSPVGQAGAKVRAVRLERDGPLNVDVDLKLDGRATITYSGFRYPLEELAGTVHIHNDNATVTRVTGRHGAARFRLDGRLMNLAHHDAQQIDLSVEASGLPLDDELAAAIDSAQSVWLGETTSQPTTQPRDAGNTMFADLGLRGQVERLTGRVTKSADGPMGYDLLADLTGARLLPAAFPYELTDTQARLRITPETVEFQRFTARHGQARIEGSGLVLPRSSPTGLSLRVAAKAVELDEDLLTALPKDSADLARKFSPQGAADLDLLYNANLPRTDDGYTVTIRPREIDVTFDEFPYTFRCVTGEIVATPDTIKLQPLQTAMDDATAELRGTVRFHDEQVSVEFSSVKADKFPLDESLLNAAPGDLSLLAKHLAPGGTCSVELKRLSLIREPATVTPTVDSRPSGMVITIPAATDRYRLAWSCQGSVTFQQAIIKIGEDPKTTSGTFTGKASSGTEGLAVDAEVALDDLQVGPRQLTELHGRIVKSPLRDMVRLEQLAARLYDGMVAGEAELKLDPLQYVLRVEFDKVDLDKLVNAGVKESDKPTALPGRLGGSITYTLRPPTKDKPASPEAVGTLQISKAKIGKLPIMLDLLNILYLSLPGDSAFTQGSVTYHLKGDTLVLNEMRFTGPALSIIGSGTLAMKTERLNLTFLTAPPNKLPELGLLKDVIESLSRELTEVRVTGTISKPKLSTRTLQSVDDVLRILLTPETKD